MQKEYNQIEYYLFQQITHGFFRKTSSRFYGCLKKIPANRFSLLPNQVSGAPPAGKPYPYVLLFFPVS